MKKSVILYEAQSLRQSNGIRIELNAKEAIPMYAAELPPFLSVSLSLYFTQWKLREKITNGLSICD